MEKYAVQPICYEQDYDSVNKRFNTIERYVSFNLYNKETLAYIVSKCFVVDSSHSLYRVVFSYNPKFGFIYSAPVYDKYRDIYLNSYITSTIYDTYEEALDSCDKKNLELLNKKVLESEEDYETAYKNEKRKIEDIRYKLDSLLRETNGLEVSKIRVR